MVALRKLCPRLLSYLGRRQYKNLEVPQVGGTLSLSSATDDAAARQAHEAIGTKHKTDWDAKVAQTRFRLFMGPAWESLVAKPIVLA